MLIEILAAVGAVILGMALIQFIVLTLAIVLEWFLDYEYIILSDPDNIAFTVKENLRTGNYKVVQGIFNKRTSTVKEDQVRVMEADDLDSKLKEKHRKNKLVIYE